MILAAYQGCLRTVKAFCQKSDVFLFNLQDKAVSHSPGVASLIHIQTSLSARCIRWGFTCGSQSDQPGSWRSCTRGVRSCWVEKKKIILTWHKKHARNRRSEELKAQVLLSIPPELIWMMTRQRQGFMKHLWLRSAHTKESIIFSKSLLRGFQLPTQKKKSLLKAECNWPRAELW